VIKGKLGNNFNKTLLQSYIITRCERRLFLELSKNKPKFWLDPVRQTIKPERIPLSSELLQELGKKYEQKVYARLKLLKNAKFRNLEGKINNLTLNTSEFVDIFNFLKVNPSEDLILLELEYMTPILFMKKIFANKGDSKEIPVNFGNQRPDIVIVGNTINDSLGEVFELRADGNILQVPEDQLNKRFGISIFDVKKTQEERIGQKHFVEIFYYMWTLAMFIKTNSLEDKFYVRANFNGIFPEQVQDNLDLIGSLKDILDNDLITLVNWEESKKIFFRIVKKIKHLWEKSPCSIESIPLHIHQGCGYCQYIEDCKSTLGCTEYSNPADWSLKLIPFTSTSIAQQLIGDFGYKTIGDVFNKVDGIKVGNVPNPIYSELPLLKLKAQALIENKLVYPDFGRSQTHSYAIPRYSPIALNFGVEYDTNNEKVFSIGIYLKMFVPRTLNYHGKFNNWWRVWRNALDASKSSEEICDELNEHLLKEITLETVKKFLNFLLSLKGIEISLKGEKTAAGTEVVYSFANVNEELSKDSEAKFAMEMISKLYAILEICTIIEDYVIAENLDGNIYGPNTSLFYWGQKQLRNFREVIERNLDYIVNEVKIREHYQRFLLYFSPSESEVENPYQHKKLFDVQKFAESCVGVPDIINYTWHGIAKILFNLDFSPKFWIPHFNFLDLNNWLRFLSVKLTVTEKQEIRSQIKRQQILKLRMIDQIRYKFQSEGKFAISKNARPISRTTYRSATLPNNYHAIAFVWYIFSLRTSTLQQQEAEYYRIMFPEFSIGKMAAAKVTDLRIVHHGENKFYYKFSIKGLSSNMKLKEGAVVLLIPYAKRDLNVNFEMYNWRVTIKEKIWDPDINGNLIITEDAAVNVFEKCKKERIVPRDQWYLYPLTFDAWSRKLANRKKTGLFQRESFGTSWLGHRLSYLWKIRSNPELFKPSKLDFGAPAIYLFAPDLLFDLKDFYSEEKLTTNIYPKPDPSQEEAIKNSLDHTISAILGPPGTGKSQTIGALIDEYLCRREKEGKETTRILITSFSYAALKVVIEKIREKSRDKEGKHTLSSQTQLIFLRSEGAIPIKKKSGCRDVDDLVRKYNGAWTFNGESRIVTPTKPLEEQLEDCCIMFANAHQLYHLIDRVKSDFAFDLICVDEASQLPIDYFMSSLQFVLKRKLNITVKDPKKPETLTLEKPDNYEPLTKVVIVGDNYQLPPVRTISPPKKLETVLSSLFSYYVDGHGIPSKQLKTNYRSHKDIVEYTSFLGFYQGLKASEKNATKLLDGDINKVEPSWVRSILSPEKVVCSIEHDNEYEIGISLLEANITAQIVTGYYKMVSPKNKLEEIAFWTKNVGVVAPHNAQGRTIIQKILQELTPLTRLDKSLLMNFLKNTVYSVEKFQGSDRDLIVTSIGLSDVDKISDECDFIFDLNRFNVLTSRAKSKLIFIASKEFLRFIPEKRKAIENTSKINFYVNKFCNQEEILTVLEENKKIKFRYKQ
jgi:DNA polymerase III delta prime subunit